MCVVIELEYVLEYDYSTIARHEFVLTCISMNCEPRITQGIEAPKIYINDNWRPSGMVLWIWTWFGIRARLGLHLFRLCRLRTGHCIGF